jgi:type IV pilus assembly protein PilB
MTKPTSSKRPVPLRPASSTRSSLKATIRDQSGAGKMRIGDLLSKEGYITRNQLEEALSYQQKHQGKLGSILIKLGHIEEETIVNVLSRIYNYPAVIISKISPEPEALKLLPYDSAKKYMAFPLGIDGDDLVISMTEPTDTSAVEQLQGEVQKGLKINISTQKDIVDAYRAYYKISDEEYDNFFG